MVNRNNRRKNTIAESERKIMAGTQNMRPVSKLPRDQFIAAARKGGIKSGETRRRKKEMRELILDLLGKKQFKKAIDDFDNVDSLEELEGKNLTIAERLVIKQLAKALEPYVK